MKKGKKALLLIVVLILLAGLSLFFSKGFKGFKGKRGERGEKHVVFIGKGSHVFKKNIPRSFFTHYKGWTIGHGQGGKQHASVKDFTEDSLIAALRELQSQGLKDIDYLIVADEQELNDVAAHLRKKFNVNKGQRFSMANYRGVDNRQCERKNKGHVADMVIFDGEVKRISLHAVEVQNSSNCTIKSIDVTQEWQHTIDECIKQYGYDYGGLTCYFNENRELVKISFYSSIYSEEAHRARLGLPLVGSSESKRKYKKHSIPSSQWWNPFRQSTPPTFVDAWGAYLEQDFKRDLDFSWVDF